MPKTAIDRARTGHRHIKLKNALRVISALKYAAYLYIALCGLSGQYSTGFTLWALAITTITCYIWRVIASVSADKNNVIYKI